MHNNHYDTDVVKKVVRLYGLTAFYIKVLEASITWKAAVWGLLDGAALAGWGTGLRGFREKD